MAGLVKQEGKVAKRYARALFEAARPTELDSIADGLKAWAEFWKVNVDWRAALSDPALEAKKRLNILQEVLALLGIQNETLVNFACLLLRNKRLAAISAVADYFVMMLNEFKKILALEVTSAFELSAEDRAEIQNTIEARLPERYAALVSVTWKVDALVLGGLMIKAADKLLDGTLEGLLNRLEREMLS